MQQPKTYRGKQSIKHLMSKHAAISNIAVTDGNIKSFERTASKYGLDFALQKDVSVEPPSYLVFFKAENHKISLHFWIMQTLAARYANTVESLPPEKDM